VDTQTLVIVAMAINVAILIVVIAVAVYQRRQRTASAATAAVAATAARANDAPSSTAIARGDPAVNGGALDAGSPWFPGRDAGSASVREDPAGSVRNAPAMAVQPGEPPGIDAATGFDLASTWARWLSEEEARILRFHRPATIVLIELAGLDRLTERLGDEVATRLIPPLATSIRRDARATDRLARLGPTRFAALLVETNEVAAINYIERIRNDCDLWLEAGAVALRLSVGWAEIGPERTADVALLDAERRLFAERERARRQLPRPDAPGADDPVEVPVLQQSGT
jgi:diguanylate cyclase (GGDEF)-like protein